MDGFTLISDPNRRLILDLLRSGERDVSELVDLVAASQPLVSKHLRVLRDAGAVVSTTSGRRRVYRLAVDPLPEVLAWLGPYAALWSHSLDSLAAALDDDTRPSEPTTPAPPTTPAMRKRKKKKR